MFKQMIKTLEDSNEPLSNSFLTFFSAIFLRNLLEAYSQTYNHLNLSSTSLAGELLHYTLSYMMMAMWIVLLFYSATKTSIKKIARLVLPGFLLLLVTPIVDLLLSGGDGIDISYLLPNNKNLWHAYLTYAGGRNGISVGIKVEVMILLIASYFYFRIKKLSILKSTFFVWLLYSLIFCCALLPILIKLCKERLGFDTTITGVSLIHAYLLILPAQAALVYYLTDKVSFLQYWRNINQSNVLFFAGMLIAGLILALNGTSYTVTMRRYLTNDTVINTLLAILAIFFAQCFISLLRQKQAKLFSYLFLALSLFYASMITARAFLIIGAFLALFYLLIAPPMALNRVLGMKTLVWFFSAFILLVLGYSLIEDNIYDFPNGLVTIGLLSLFLLFGIGRILMTRYLTR